MEFSTGIAPPLKPVPDPRGTMGNCSSFARRTIFETSSGFDGRTAASGIWGDMAVASYE